MVSIVASQQEGSGFHRLFCVAIACSPFGFIGSMYTEENRWMVNRCNAVFALLAVTLCLL